MNSALTNRERQVAALLTHGLPTKTIARRLEISPRTVECHLHKIFVYLGVSSRTQAALALTAGAP